MTLDLVVYLMTHTFIHDFVFPFRKQTGMFSYDQHDLFVKPLRNDHAEQYRRRRRDAVDPHIVYRRSVDDGSDAAARFCSPPPRKLELNWD